MILACAIGIGIPGLVLGIYAWGRWMYGEQWYLALGRNSTWGADDPVSDEIDDARITRLKL
jgi:hypothetical protein